MNPKEGWVIVSAAIRYEVAFQWGEGAGDRRWVHVMLGVLLLLLLLLPMPSIGDGTRCSAACSCRAKGPRHSARR